MADAPSSSAAQQPTKGKKKAAASTSAETFKPREPFKPVRPNAYGRQVADFVRTATAKDRLNVPRGPCTLPVLKEAWVNGVIDSNTLIWGQGLADFIPIRNVRTLVPQIRTVEVQLATWVKKQFALKPALSQSRKERAEQRPGTRTTQVDTMF
ncbi:hypothetical protein N2152v2_005300 [Parachlorella kessleri]